jgi:hypothetical protein
VQSRPGWPAVAKLTPAVQSGPDPEPDPEPELELEPDDEPGVDEPGVDEPGADADPTPK